MAIEVTIPRLGWSMDEGTFVEWLKADGELVHAGEAIFALESEKALQEVESLDSGILKILPDAPQEGETVTVGTLVAYLVEEGESIPVRASTTQEPVTDKQHHGTERMSVV
jgi:pyruvate dehydrogenase E2 component (dihydrolipoamide acetyltransferase)